MKPFLRQVADHYYGTSGISSKCFIFPNNRSLAFFRHFLGLAIRDDSAKMQGRAVMAPKMMTMNDFFYKVSGYRQAHKVELLLRLYECYRRLNPKAESLDDFIFWGEVILADFSDVDKYMVDADGVFNNISDLKALQDKFEYLSEQQRAAIGRFLSHFREYGSVKENFKRIWDILLPLYKDFREALDGEGLCYEGQAYRKFADSSESVADSLARSFPDTDKFVFVGLNALNECERKVMKKMRNAGLAEFCWDYSSEYIKDKDNKSSFFMEDNVASFPQAFQLDSEGLPQTTFNVLSVPSAVGQAKQLPSILGARAGMETAIVIPDENLLIPVLNSIPGQISDLNVTMGYPMKGSMLSSLIQDIAALQLHLREKDGQWYFYHKQVWSILSNSLVRTAAGDAGVQIADNVKKEARYYIPVSAFGGVKAYELIFKPVVKAPQEAVSMQTDAIGEYLMEAVAGIASLIKQDANMSLELHFAMDCYKSLVQLSKFKLDVLPATYFRLLGQLTAGSAVPFKGEPLKGLQIMGPLETRALDFENVIILSCNEGVFPRSSAGSSFIPAELRRAFGLPTYEYQDAVWAYYFYRLIQRATNVWLVFDSRTEALRSGEESRYIKQLEMHFKALVRRSLAKAPISSHETVPSVPKTAEDVETIRSKVLSATALQRYLACPAQFYYSFVRGLTPENEVAETLDNGMVGSVFHATMQYIYGNAGGRASAEFIRKWIGERERIREYVYGCILEELHCFEVSGRNLVYADIICKYVIKTLERDLQMLKDNGSAAFDIRGLEIKLFTEIDGFRFKGTIDRLDSMIRGTLRVVDYKTGKVEDGDVSITDDKAEGIVEALFQPDNEKRPKIALQLYLYDVLVRSQRDYKGESLYNTIYPASQLFKSAPLNVPLNRHFSELMEKRLSALLDELVDISVPFRRTSLAKTCEYCDFKMICGK